MLVNILKIKGLEGLLHTFPTGAIKMAVQQGVQMFLIPKANSSCTEQVAQEFEATAKLEVDEEGYEAMKEPLTSLTGPDTVKALPSVGSPSHASNIGVPTSGACLGLGDNASVISMSSQVVEDYSEEGLEALVLKLKKCENLTKVGLSQLPLMKGHSEDRYGTRVAIKKETMC